jgi:soluble lytic murein transglycosylase-like protein
MKPKACFMATLALAVATAAPLPSPAEESGPMFRRVAVPGPDHDGPRINIQIRPGDNFTTLDPAERAALSQPREPVVQTAAAATPMPLEPGATASWFWSEVSPAMPATLARYWAAEALFSEFPREAQAVTPRLAHVSELAETYGRELLAATVGTSVSPAFALAVIAVESAGRRDAVSHAGAQGLMQLIPATAERFGVTDSFDPAQNIRGGVAYLDWLMEEFGRDPILVLAAYNAGEGAVQRAGGVPDYEETRNYVPRVLAAWQVARGLCLTPPELVSDGCVFAPMARR